MEDIEREKKIKKKCEEIRGDSKMDDKKRKQQYKGFWILICTKMI